jgi:hypothetical protein
MAALDWATKVSDLNTAKQSTSAAEEEIADNLIDELTKIGTPYDVAYTPAVEAQKDSDYQAFSDATNNWLAEVVPVHDQTDKILHFTEDSYSDLERTAAISWSANPSTMAFNKTTIVSRLGTYISKAQSDENAVWDVDGLHELLIRYRGLFVEAYDAMPVLSYGGSYGTARVITVEGYGAITVQKAEELLQGFMDEADRLIAAIAYTP